MDGEELERHREQLLREKARVEHLVGQVRSEVECEEEAEHEELAHYDQHPADGASDTFEREKDLSILESLEAELAEIEAALARIDEGTYGVDEVTGRPIDPARLDAVPSARTNIEKRHFA